MSELADIGTLLLVLISAAMCFAAGVGLIRFPDVLGRLHAATKPQILGLLVVCVDIVIAAPQLGTITLVTAIVVLQWMTAPISAHMVARSAYRTGHFRPEILIKDELARRSDLE